MTRWLEQGLGRAFAFVQSHPPRSYRKILLRACLRDLTFDPQCEDGREAYLWDLIQASGDAAFYRAGLLRALGRGHAGRPASDVAQIFALAGKFAETGDGEMRSTMYSAFLECTDEDALYYIRGQLTDLDGLNALELIAERFLQRAGAEPEIRELGFLVDDLKQREGDAKVEMELQRRRQTSAALDQMLRLLKADEETPGSCEPDPTYAEIKRLILEEPDRCLRVRRWARKHATEEELDVAANDLLSESEPRSVAAYLLIFSDRRFPRSFDRLIDLARSEDDTIARRALAALRQFTDPRVRALALECRHRDDRSGEAVELLAVNYEDGDYGIVEELLQRDLSEFSCHGLGLGVLDFVELHLDRTAARALTLLYENGPCTRCRRRCVQHLRAIDCIPD